MNESDRIAAAAAAAAVKKEMMDKVARARKERLVEITGIEGDDDDALVVGNITFSPEVERRMADWPGKYRGPNVRYVHLNDLNEDDKWSIGSEPPPKGTDDAARADGTNDVAKDSRSLSERAAYVPLPPVPEGTPHQPKTEEVLGDGADGGGKRMNAGKLRVELVPPEWLFALADVMTQGSKKYEPRNWEKGMKWSTMLGSMKRHIAKFEAGSRYDGKGFDLEKGTTGCHHLAMAAWNALALLTYDLRRKGTNDIPNVGQLDLFDSVNAATSHRNDRWDDDERYKTLEAGS